MIKLFLLFLTILVPKLVFGATLPTLIRLSMVAPNIIQEMRYATDHNFVGRPIKGYGAAECWVTVAAAKALTTVEAKLGAHSLSLKVYDCYRPQRAVDDFVAWSKDLTDVKMKREFYPKIDKSTLFHDGYIAEKSGHSRGSTVDLTLVHMPAGPQGTYPNGQDLKECYRPQAERFLDNSLDMGTGYDCFDPRAHTENPEISPEQKQNRQLLKSVMEQYGFKNYDQEWWHFTLKNEPYPNKYFDIEIK